MLALEIPNILWARRKPVGYDPSGESKALLIFERAGQALCTATILFFSDTNPRGWELWIAWLFASALLMVLYEVYWIRYFTKGRTLRDFYRPLFGIPAPGAALPVAAFLLLGVYGRLIWLVIASVILGIGHIGIHLQHIKKLRGRRRADMRIIVINGTEHKGCTFAMKELFLDAVGRDNAVTEFNLPSDCPEFCTGCKACFYNDISVCPHKQYTVPIWEAISAADLLVFTSPVYVFHATAQMKAPLDHYATKWMAHSPESQMFSKQAVIITNAASAGMKNVLKDIGDSLRYWGVARIYCIKQGLFESRWEFVTDKRKANVKRQCEKVCRRLKPAGEVKPSAGVKGRFYIMRMAQKMIHKDQLKKGQPETRDHTHWQKNGWLGSARPWQ